ncbi:MAG: efflux RND transporter periplasmic adaptor subunit [Firmicutes bacterium]|jgi:HlyD family secretion protein|nr:efflux RND transporter periplasmic adaptor subunit [Bacillota bacterium]MDH7495912.1 efflux RND transporter periplasmic adaptor subunit [Bacillota bacterium]
MGHDERQTDASAKRFDPIVRRPPAVRGGRFRRDAGLIAFVVVVLGVVVAVPAYLLIPRERPYVLANYTYAEVRLGEFHDEVGAPGTVVPARTVEVRAGSGGIVQEIMVAPGERVDLGAPVCQLHSPELVTKREDARHQVLSAEDSLAKARLDASLTEKRLERELAEARKTLAAAQAKHADARQLYEAGAIPRRQVDEAQTEVDRAQSQVETRELELSAAKSVGALQIDTCARQLEAARSSLKSIEDAIAGLVLRSPIQGTVLDVPVVPGAMVGQGTVVAQVADLKRLVVKAKVRSFDVQHVTVGQRATVIIGGASLGGRVHTVAPKADESGEGTTVEVVVELDSPSKDVLPNSAAYVEIQVRERRGVSYLPRGAYLASGQEMFVYVVEGNRAYQRDVRFGKAYDNAVEVLDGLSAGEKVITSSYEEFKHRREIKVLPEGGRAQ